MTSHSIKLVNEQRTVKELILLASEKFGPAPALTDGIKVYKYNELRGLAEASAIHLTKIGVKPGDRVIVIADNCLEIVQLLLACAWLGAILVPLNPLSRESQLKYYFETVEPAAIFVDGKIKLKLEDFSFPFLSKYKILGLDQLNLIEHYLTEVSSGEISQHLPSDTLAILFTSGTTGHPKGVMCPNGQFIAWGEIVGDLLKIEFGDVVYTCLPLFHTNALNAFMQSITHGGKYHLGERFSVSQFWTRMREAETDVTYLLGAMVSMLLSAPETENEGESNIRIILAPGTPVASLKEFERRFGVPLVEAHGMTETNAAIGPDDGAQKLGHMGRVLNGFEAKVIDFDGLECMEGVPGELLLKTSMPFAFASGYWKQEEETKIANRNGWFHTGDRVVCQDGWYKFLDRIKDIIRRRGENISAREVELAIQAISSVLTVAVVAVPSELGEDEVMAFIVEKEGSSHTAEEILDSCSTYLPHFALPRFIEFVEALPMTDNSKIRKVELRERGVQAGTWDSQKAGYVPKR
jgi:crotonobetaine/carnitine-CoA ligase